MITSGTKTAAAMALTTAPTVAAKTTSTSLITQPGVYWLQLTVTLPANTSTYTKLNGVPYSTAIYTTTTNYPPDTLTTDTIQYVASTSSLAVTSQNTPNTTVNSTKYGEY